MQEPTAWVLNLDAELEMEHCSRPGAGAYTPSQRTLASVRQSIPRIQGLIVNDDTVLWPSDGGVTAAVLGKVWCVTDSALIALSGANVATRPMPSVDCVREVNHRAFALQGGGGAPGARWVETPHELQTLLGETRSTAWLFKRAYGFAGRGQRRISGAASEADRRWLDNALELGMVAEPLMDVVAEFSLHGQLDQSGALRLGRPCRQFVDSHRAWSLGQLAKETELCAEFQSRLFDTAERVADALSEHGYFGPFGIDAYTYRDASGSIRFNALSELNARYTMTWGLGMGG